MEMNKYGMSAVALLGALLLGNGQAQASETVNTILGGGVGGVAGTMIGKQLGGDTGALVGAAVGGAAGGAATADRGNKNEAALGGAVGALGGAAIGKSVGGSTGQLARCARTPWHMAGAHRRRGHAALRARCR